MTRLVTILSIAFLAVGCGTAISGSTAANEWINSLETGMSKDEIEASKPEHVKVYWDMAYPVDSVRVEYDVVYRDDRDFAPTPYYLVFRKGVYSHYSGRN